MKEVFTGWMPRSSKIDREFFAETLTEHDIFPDKGRKIDYATVDWPPKKVRVTVEVDDE